MGLEGVKSMKRWIPNRCMWGVWRCITHNAVLGVRRRITHNLCCWRRSCPATHNAVLLTEVVSSHPQCRAVDRGRVELSDAHLASRGWGCLHRPRGASGAWPEVSGGRGQPGGTPHQPHAASQRPPGGATAAPGVVPNANGASERARWREGGISGLGGKRGAISWLGGKEPRRHLSTVCFLNVFGGTLVMRHIMSCWPFKIWILSGWLMTEWYQ